ncbi:MAG: hypothetical protein WCY37_04980 [Candidatus Dojkabacteria bacterium]
MKLIKGKYYIFTDDTCQSIEDFLNGRNRRHSFSFKQKFVGMKEDKYLFESKNGSKLETFQYTEQGLKDWKVIK